MFLRIRGAGKIDYVCQIVKITGRDLTDQLMNVSTIAKQGPSYKTFTREVLLKREKTKAKVSAVTRIFGCVDFRTDANKCF